MAILPDISEHLHIKEGFCYPDWLAIAAVIDEHLPESDWHAAWEKAAQCWMNRLRENLGGKYQVYEATKVLLLSEAPIHEIKEACGLFEDGLRQILERLDGVASDVGYGKHIVMMFTSLHDYYKYITNFYAVGDGPIPEGICLRGDIYTHYAFPPMDYSSYRSVLVHELTHSCLGHLPIPLWLNEALAMRMQQVICSSDSFIIDQEIYERHVAHWNHENIQQFWQGDSWYIFNDNISYIYNLAQVLWRKIETDLNAPRSAILQFIVDAHYEDGGEAAFQNTFGLSLGDLVTDFLGDGTWAPEPAKWNHNSQLDH
jgi:hypothetical protein